MPGRTSTGARTVRPRTSISTASSLAIPRLAAVDGRDERRVVPRELRDRIAELLQPRAVAEASVVNLRVGEEHDLERGARRRQGSRARARSRSSRSVVAIADSRLRVDHAVYEGLLPERARVALRHRRPVFFDQLPRRRAGRAGQPREDLADGLALRERPHQRLRDRGGAVERARVAPGLEEVGLRDEPSAQAGRLVFVESDVGGHGTDAIRRAISRSADAVYAGLPPTITRAATSPASMARTSASRPWLACPASITGDGAYVTVRPALPRRSFAAWASACTSGGCPSPASDEARARVPGGPARRPGPRPRRGPARRRDPAARRDDAGDRGSAERRQRGEDRRGDASHLARLHAQALVGAHPRRRQPRLDDVEPAHRVSGPARSCACRPRRAPRPSATRPRRGSR